MFIPKSSSAQRQGENLDVFGFSLSGDEIAAITELGRSDGAVAGLGDAAESSKIGL